jgi:hypothetical protein
MADDAGQSGNIQRFGSIFPDVLAPRITLG